MAPPVKVWIDLANSPHVLFFAPIVRGLRARGAEVLLTARDFAQTVGLARLHGLDVTTVGSHGGKSTIGKARGILDRAARLRRLARRAHPAVAVSHNSYAHAIAARSLGIPYLTIMDYEHTPANHVSFRLAGRILLPAAIDLATVKRYGARSDKVARYDGFKEQVYLDGFSPDRSRLGSLLPPGAWDRYVIAVARPPADFAIYHRFENPLFETWLRHAAADPDTRVVVLPRTPAQRERLTALRLPGIIVPEQALDGANLVHHADLVVSAGGTMNREAAVLGIPAYSLFMGEIAAVDRALEALGRLCIVRDEPQALGIPLRRKPPPVPLANPGLREQILDTILAEASARGR